VVEDLVVDLVFEPVKQHLKRDLSKWRVEKAGKSINGSIGNLKRWAPDLFKLYEKGKLTLEEALNQASDRKTSHPDKNTSHPVANVAVNAIVTVTDNGTINTDEAALLFEGFRKAYPGTKLGHDTEFAVLKKHKDWKSILPLLLPAIQAEIRARATAKQQQRFFPEPKNLKTYLNQRSWEAYSEVSAQTKMNDEEQYEAYRKAGIQNLSGPELEWVYDYQHKDLSQTWRFPDEDFLMKPDKYFTRKMADEYAAG